MPVGVAPTNASPTPATASAIAMRMALRRKIVVRLLIEGGVYTIFGIQSISTDPNLQSQ